MAPALTADERTELERRTRSRRIRAEDARRAQVILMLADGESFMTIARTVGCYPAYIARWKDRFEVGRLAGLRAQYRGQAPTVRTPALEARVLAKTRQKPSDGSTHWTTRKLAKVLGTSHMLVARIWRRAGYQPHRFQRYMLSDDPLFEEKAADVIGLYLKPPQHAAVFAADEKTAIQALDRLDPVLPLSPGRAERHGFEYYRHGTLSLYAAMNTKTGEIIGQTVPRHTSAAFVEFLQDVVATQPRDRAIHVIVDNLAAHKTKAVQRSSRHIRACSSTSRRPTRPGSTRWNSGSTRSSGISWRGASSRRCPTSPARSDGTSRATTRTQNRSAGPTAIQRIE
jgi:transposase